MGGQLGESTLLASTKNGWVVLIEPFNPNGNQNVLCRPYT